MPRVRVIGVLLFLGLVSCVFARGVSGAAPALPVFGHVRDFSLVDQSGRPLRANNLAGHVWITDFIYTTCNGPCPMMTQKMGLLVRALPQDDRLRFVSFSVDPENDTPEVLKQYAATSGATDPRWLFVTGDRATIYALGQDSFHLVSEKGETGPVHSTFFALVDGSGAVRGFYRMDDALLLRRITSDVAALLPPPTVAGIPIHTLPTINAVLNTLSALLVGSGFWLLAGCVTSTLFLVSYLTYHFHVGSVHFEGVGWMRPVYYAILISHTSLAVATVPLVFTTVSRALRGRFDRHVAIARWTLPIWLYVSCTGVVVYLLLYHL